MKMDDKNSLCAAVGGDFTAFYCTVALCSGRNCFRVIVMYKPLKV